MTEIERGPLAERIQAYTAGYKIIDPERYSELGVDPGDVELGTVPAEDNPGFLASRYGGNAFGLGLFEHQARLDKAEARLLDGLDLNDPADLAANYRRLNGLYKRLGLFIRYSRMGRPYYLIPRTWLAHSTAEIQDRAEELEKQVRLFQQARLKERLSILILTPLDDLLAAELTWRLGGYRLTLSEKLEELRELPGKYDLIILPQDPTSFVLSRATQLLGRAKPRKRELFLFCRYLSTKLYDLLDEGGRLIILGPRVVTPNNRVLEIHFDDQRKQKNFLLFSHIIKTTRRYRSPSGSGRMKIAWWDFFNFLTLEMIPLQTLRKLTRGRPVGELSPAQIDGLPYLDLKPKAAPFPNQAQLWQKLFNPLFEQKALSPLSLERTTSFMAEGLELSAPMPRTEMLYVGDKRKPQVSLSEVEAAAKRMGLPGCELAILAEYKDSFSYLLKVLQILIDIRADRYASLPPLIRARIRMPFDRRRTERCFFKDIPALLRFTPRLARLAKGLNPFDIEGSRTPVLANLEKLSLLGYKPELLREIFLILVGHSTLSRIVLGKLMPISLTSFTQPLGGLEPPETVDNVLAVRLMSLAEMAALRENGLDRAQAEELFRLADLIIAVTSDPELDWEDLKEQALGSAEETMRMAIRRLAALFGIFEHLDDWQTLLPLGEFEKDSISGYDPGRQDRLETVLTLVRAVQTITDHYDLASPGGFSNFPARFLDKELHGTTRLLPALGPRHGISLLWLATCLCQGPSINFNPLHGELPPGLWEERVERIKKALDCLGREDLDPARLGALAARIAPDKPAFIYDTGLTVTRNSALGTMDFSFVEVEEDLKRLNHLLMGMEARSISDLPRTDLAEINILYGHLDGYRRFMEQGPIRELNQSRGEADLYPVRAKKISLVLHKLNEAFTAKLFQPEDLYDHLTRLRDQAPQLMTLLLPELSEMETLPPAAPHYPGPNMLHFFQEAAYKFQGLATGRLGAFQDQQLLHRLAVKEFGPQAAGGVGVTADQMETLSQIMDRLRAKRHLLKAATVALTFQDVDRLPSLREKHGAHLDSSEHGPAGALILKESGILDRYLLAPRTREVAVWLVEHHGLLGRVVRGESPLGSLEVITAPGDSDLFDIFFLHNLAAMAAVRPESLTEDLMDRLLRLRGQALSIIQGRTDWLKLIMDHRREQRQWLLDLAASEGLDDFLELLPGGEDCFPRDLEEQPLSRWPLSGLERLFCLRNLWFLNFEAVCLFKLNHKLEYIHRRLGLASLGPASLERALFDALRIEKRGLGGGDLKACSYVLGRLADLDRPTHLPALSLVLGYLNPSNRIRLIALALKAAEPLGGDRQRPVTIRFDSLAEAMTDRYEFVNEALAGIDLNLILGDPAAVDGFLSAQKGLALRLDREHRFLTAKYIDMFDPDEFAKEAAGIKSSQRLAQTFHKRLKELRRSPHNVQAYELALERIYEDRQNRIVESMAHKVETRLSAAPDLTRLYQAYQDFQEDPVAYEFDQRQRQSLRQAFEVRREQLRQRAVREWAARLERIRGPEELRRLWEESKLLLQARRKYLGRQLERRIARWFDLKAAVLDRERN